jgi:hypothetical protein
MVSLARNLITIQQNGVKIRVVCFSEEDNRGNPEKSVLGSSPGDIFCTLKTDDRLVKHMAPVHSGEEIT